MSRDAKPRISKTRHGYALNLPKDERAILQELPLQLLAGLEMLEAGDPAVSDGVRRILPLASPRDEKREAGFVSRRRDELLAGHIEVLDIVSKTAQASELNAEELNAWLIALTDLRLALGVMLGVTEQEHELDPDAEDYADWICYHYLSFLQSEIIDLMVDDLPPPTPGAGDELPDDPWGDPLGGLRWDGTPVPESNA